jgi:hypothetical protein
MTDATARVINERPLANIGVLVLWSGPIRSGDGLLGVGILRLARGKPAKFAAMRGAASRRDKEAPGTVEIPGVL